MRELRWSPDAAGQVAGRWALAGLAAFLPPGLSLLALGGLWAAALGAEGLRGVAPASGLTIVAVALHVVLYAGP